MISKDQTHVKLTDLIAPAFYGVHWDIIDGKHTYYDLYGGRGSTKSSFAGLEIVLGMMEDPDANAIIYRKVGNTIGDSVYEQVLWAIDALEVSHLWKCKTSPYRCIYKPTGQRIIFKGLDKAKKSKSAKVRKGYFKYLWFEELDEFAGIEEIRMVQQSILRGGPKFVVFKTFNPPISKSNWANKYVQEPREDSLRHKSDYRSVPVEWLGKQFHDDAEHLQKVNPKAYEHEYLGNPVGLGTNIFEFLEIRTITDEEIERMERIYQGQDWGWYPDPKAFVRSSYNHNSEVITAIDELGGCKIRNAEMARQIKVKGYDDYEIRCGLDEQESIVDFRDAGLPARQANGGPGSVKYTFEWLQCRKIVVDPARTPRLYKEMIEYEHEVDGNGEVIPDYPDKNNHWIDALRYATSPLSMRRGNSA
ncbi:phage terminase, large subunit, PBSX family [Lacrimispora sphenoides]|uniref:PBSX family phage terminase large subunit n=1 Tax=Lacrimispora sphenoides TaxID=29370 RepID=UPI0008BCD65C|nr:PBSX family phage terminase large subunit [Lacrimispora sphenoides]SET71317.1 phage terminase, large subunit, PBSX family [Lacrimispora sphenoides]